MAQNLESLEVIRKVPVTLYILLLEHVVIIKVA